MIAGIPRGKKQRQANQAHPKKLRGTMIGIQIVGAAWATTTVVVLFMEMF